jgi:hypothetical protein
MARQKSTREIEDDLVVNVVQQRSVVECRAAPIPAWQM